LPKKFIKGLKKDFMTRFFAIIIPLVLLASSVYLVEYNNDISPIHEDTTNTKITTIFEPPSDPVKRASIAELLESPEQYEGESVRTSGFLRSVSDGVQAYLQDGIETVRLDVSDVKVPYSYNGMRVEVEGSLFINFGEQMKIKVKTVSLIGSESHGTRSTRSLTGDQDILVIMVRFNDFTATRYNVTKITQMMFDPNNSVNALYYENSYQNINITGQVVGWYDLPDDRIDYRPTDDLSTDFGALTQDAVDLADDDVNFDLYRGIIVLINGPWFRGLGLSSWSYTTDEGTKDMMAAIVGENPGDTDAQVWGRIGHEVGHQFALGHVSPGYNNPFALMAKLLPGHLCAWSKMRPSVDWLPTANMETVNPGSIETHTVQPLENIPLGSDVFVIKVPITDNRYYMVEVRRLTGYDIWMPDEGVIIYLVNEDRGSPIDLMDSKTSTVTLNDAPWDVGESFVDSANDINITVDSELVDQGPFVITVQNGVSSDPPDVSMDHWGDPPGNPPPYETADIWIDSELNGWDRYRYNDGDPSNPTGNGDTPWAGNINRLYATVRNLGGSIALGARVNFYENTPMGIGDRGEWNYIGNFTVDIVGEGEVTDYVEWEPPLPGDAGSGIVEVHSCIKVEIEPVPGETNIDNQFAQENIYHFEITTGSGFRPATMEFIVANPYPTTQRIFLVLDLSELPIGWTAVLDNDTFLLGPHETTTANITVNAPSVADPSTLYGTSAWAHIKGLTIVGPSTPEFMHFEELGGITLNVNPVENVEEGDVTIEVSTPSITTGGTLFITGGIAVMPNFVVALTLTSPTGVKITRTVETDKDGSFNESFKPTVSGNWTVKLSSSGDKGHSSVLSQDLAFVVEPEEESEPPKEEDKEEEGISFNMLIIAVVACAVLFILIGYGIGRR
jgi:M6 family metalloprotease-like protein